MASWLSFYAPDVEMFARFQRGDEPDVYRGAKGMRRLALELEARFDQVRWEIEVLVDAGDRVVGLFHRRCRDKDHRWVAEWVPAVYSVRDGIVARVESYPSWREALGSVESGG